MKADDTAAAGDRGPRVLDYRTRTPELRRHDLGWRDGVLFFVVLLIFASPFILASLGWRI